MKMAIYVVKIVKITHPIRQMYTDRIPHTQCINLNTQRRHYECSVCYVQDIDHAHDKHCAHGAQTTRTMHIVMMYGIVELCTEYKQRFTFTRTVHAI